MVDVNAHQGDGQPKDSVINPFSNRPISARYPKVGSFLVELGIQSTMALAAWLQNNYPDAYGASSTAYSAASTFLNLKSKSDPFETVIGKRVLYLLGAERAGLLGFELPPDRYAPSQSIAARTKEIFYRVAGSVSNPTTAGFEFLTPENVNKVGAHGMTPLLIAARSGKLNEFDRIIELGGDPTYFIPSRTYMVEGQRYTSPSTVEDYIGLFAGSDHEDREEIAALLRARLIKAREVWSRREGLRVRELYAAALT